MNDKLLGKPIGVAKYNNFYKPEQEADGINPSATTELNEHEPIRVDTDIEPSSHSDNKNIELIDKRRTKLLLAVYRINRKGGSHPYISQLIKDFGEKEGCEVQDIHNDLTQLRDPSIFLFHKTTLQQSLQKLNAELAAEISDAMQQSESFTQYTIVHLALKYKSTPRKIANEIKRNKTIKANFQNLESVDTVGALKAIRRYLKLKMLY
ncbi:hypothetical protein ACRN9G_18810 [Shewanella frigidimarina]|uniref:hypothetical protein n=1 Tax=Shewanella frigidimarina TaxID=56812 RepID=UPI003D79E3DD